MKKPVAVLLLLSLPAVAADADGKAIFEKRCQGCHGADGAGHTRMGQKIKLPDFSSTKWQQATSDKEMTDVIANGSKQNEKMKPFKDKLSAEEIQAVAHYLRGLGKAP